MYDTSRITVSGVGLTVFKVVNGMQDVPEPADRMVGLAATLLIAARSKGLCVSELLNQADRVLHDGDRHIKPALGAAYEYARNEL